MSKRHQLRSKLKASDRRRKRRAEGGVLTQEQAERPAVDVTGMLVDVIIGESDVDRLRDAFVVAALRACLREVAPGGDIAADLYDRLQAVVTERGVDRLAFRKAVDRLLTEAKHHSDAGRGDGPAARSSANAGAPANPFVAYLAMMAG